MSLFTFFLLLHLAGAVVAGFLIITAWYAGFTEKSVVYRRFAKSIALSSGYQLVTGALLGFTSFHSVSVFCSRIVLYVTIMSITEYMLFVKMKETESVFPVRTLAYSTAFGLFLSLTALLPHL